MAATFVESLEGRRHPSAVAPGSLDPTFGLGGAVELHLRTPVQTFLSASTSLPGGKALLVGQYRYDAVAIARFNADGSPDETFGPGGLVVARGVPIYPVTAVAVSKSGDIYLGGSTTDAAAVVRLSPTGQLVRSFGHHACVILTRPSPPPVNIYSGRGPSGQINALAFEPDGTLLAGGFALGDSATYSPGNNFLLARLHADDGSPDPYFGGGGDGVVITHLSNRDGPLDGSIHSLHVFADGSFLAGGGGDGSLELARYTVHGALDRSFAHHGVARLSAGGPAGTNFTDDTNRGGPWITAIAVRPGDGHIFVIGGTPLNPGVQKHNLGHHSGPLVLAAFDARGRPDGRFGRRGAVRQLVAAANGPLDSFGVGDIPNGLVLLPNGKLQVTGRVEQNGAAAEFVGRFNAANGSPDATFAPVGLPPAPAGTTPAPGVRWIPAQAPDFVDTFTAIPAADGSLVIPSNGPTASAHSPFSSTSVPPGGSSDATFGSAASTYSELSAIRLLPDGSPDLTYGRNGTGFASIVPPQVRGAARPTQVIPIPRSAGGGAYVEVAGTLTRSAFRVRPSGRLIAAFQEALATSSSSFYDPSTQVRAVQPDGKVLVTSPGSYGVLLVTRLNPDGSRDPTFGRRGVVRITQPADQVEYQTLTAPAVLVRPDDGSIVLVVNNTVQNTLFRLDSTGRIVASRLLPFAPYTNDIGFQGFAPSADAALAPDGKVIVGLSNFDFFSDALPDAGVVLRFNADDLTPDASFGQGGMVTGPLPGGVQRVVAMPDGRILVGGSLAPPDYVDPESPYRFSELAMLDPSGTADPSFGTGGVVPLSPASGLFARPDGRILVVEQDPRRLTDSVVQFTTGGAIDQSFGVGGALRLPIGRTVAGINVAADGSGDDALLVAGATGPRRYQPDDVDHQESIGLFYRVVL